MTAAGIAGGQAGLLVAQRGAHVIAAALFAVLVPRLMGPDDFGRYALMTSVSMWFALLSGLGASSLMTRVVPDLVARNERDALAKLVTNLIALRAVAGAASAAIYLLVTAGWFGDLDRIALGFMAGAVFSRTTGNPAYALFLGLNRAAQWGLGDLLRRWLTLVLVVVGFVVGDIRGACFGVLAANLIVLALGLWWGREYLRWRELRLDLPYLAPYLRLSTAFAAGNLLLALAQRSGEALVRVQTGSYSEAGVYAAAYAVYLTAADAVWHLTLAFAPFLVARHAAGAVTDVRLWIERIARLTVAGSCLMFITAAWLADIVIPVLFGDEFRGVALNLLPMMMALVALAIGSAGRLTALVVNRPGLSAQAAIIEVGVFWSAGLLLTARWGSVGASVATFASIALYAAYLTWRLRGVVRYSLGRPLLAVFLALPAAALAWLAEPSLRAALIGGVIAAYLASLWALRLLTPDDLRAFKKSPSPRAESAVPASPSS